MGIFNFEKLNTNQPSIDLTDYKFLSDDHTRVQNGQSTNTNNKGAWRGIRVQTSDNKTFYVTMYNMNENHPVWGDNIQMAEKQMKLINEKKNKIVLRGYGIDTMGSSFADYGLTLHKSNGKINKISLHMYDRNVDIIYEKAEDKKQIETLNKSSDFEKTKDTFEYAFEKKRSLKYNISEINTSQIVSDEILQKTDFSAIYLKNGDFNQALSAIETNILILQKINSSSSNYIQNKDFWKMYAFKAFILESTQNYKNAIDYYELAIETAFDDVKVYALYHQIGWCYLNLKDDDNAVKFYTHSIELKKIYSNKYKEDLEGIDNGVLLGKNFEQMYVNRGNSLKNINRLEEARQDCISAIECNQQYSNPYLLLSQILDLAGQKEKSMELLKHASDMGNQNATRIYRNGGF